MMGLLDNFGGNLDDPYMQAKIALGSGLLNSRGNFGQGLGQAVQQAMGAYGDARKAQQQKAIQEQQMQAQALQQQMMQQQIAEAQRAAADRQRQQAFLQGLPSPQMQAAGQAMAGGGGPTQAAAANMAPVDPMQQLLHQGVKAGALPLDSYINSMRKDSAPLKLGAGEALLDPKTFKPIFTNPKEDAVPGAVREYEYAVKQGYPGTFEQWDVTRKKAGATNIAMPKIDIKTGESIGAQVGPMLRESRDKAVAGVKLVDSANRILSAAERGGLFAGPGANLLMKGAQVADVFGIAGKDTKEKISNTRSVIRGMAEQAVAARSQLGGQAQISNSEQELLNKATSGDIAELTAGEIVQIAKLNDRLGRQLYASHDDVMNTVKSRPDLQSTEPFYRAPKMPDAYKPAAKRDVISEADRILNGSR